MSFLLKLPSDVHTNVLLEWLNLDDWSRLDNSFCSRDNRQQFLDVLKNAECFSSPINSVNFFSWSFSRGIGFKHIHLNSKRFGSDGQLHFPFRYDKVLEILVDVRPSATVFDVINKCTNIEGIECTSGEIIRNLDPEILRNLKGLIMYYGEDFVATSESILRHCRNLTHLRSMSVPFEICDTFVDLYIEIIKVNPQLTDVLFPGGTNTFNSLAMHCRSIRTVTMGLMRMPTAEVGQFIGGSPSVTSVTLEDYDYRTIRFIRQDLTHLIIAKGDTELHLLLSAVRKVNVVKLVECDLSPACGAIPALLSASADTLLSLNIESCTNLSADSILQILSQCKVLDVLEIKGNNFSAVAFAGVTATSNITIRKLFVNGINLKASTVLYLLQSCPKLTYCYATITTEDRSEAVPLLQYARDGTLITQFDFNQSRGMMAAMMYHTPNNEPATVVHDEEGFTGMNHHFYTGLL